MSGLGVPVLKPNEAMMEEAIQRGRTIGVLSVFEPTVPSINRELHDIAIAMNMANEVSITTKFVPEVLQILQRGDEYTYNSKVAEAAVALQTQI